MRIAASNTKIRARGGLVGVTQHILLSMWEKYTYRARVVSQVGGLATPGRALCFRRLCQLSELKSPRRRSNGVVAYGHALCVLYRSPYGFQGADTLHTARRHTRAGIARLSGVWEACDDFVRNGDGAPVMSAVE